MKNKKKKIESAFISSFNKIKRHYLFSSVFDRVNLIVLDDEQNKQSDVVLLQNDFCYLKVEKDTRCSVYVFGKNRLDELDWEFIFSMIGVYLGLELYKKSVKNSFTKVGCLLFAMHYLKSVMGNNNIPVSWQAFNEVENLMSFRNEDVVIEQLRNDNNLFLKVRDLGFVEGGDRKDIVIKEDAVKHNINWSGKALVCFSDLFMQGLIEQAKKTIALRSSSNLSKEVSERKNTQGYKAKHWFEMGFPLLSALAASFEINEDIGVCRRLDIKYAAVSAEEKMIFINPVAGLTEMGYRFCIAHEILHVALDHAGRRGGRDFLMWNLACDFVINDWLIQMNIGCPPENIFYDKTLSGLSADEIYLMIASNSRLMKKMITLRGSSPDMLDKNTSYFADFINACKESLLRGIFMHEVSGRGDLPYDMVEEIKLINQPVIPWQVELAQWIATRFPLEEGKRTYARPSRRQSSTPDIARPSYIKPIYDKHTRTFGVVMDTSASMDRELLGKCLGAITSYGMAQEVKEIRLVYCDAQPYDEGFVPLEMLVNKVKVRGRGGTVLQPAVNYLENIKDFPESAPILILTDGFFEEDLKVKREHAFLVPDKSVMPINDKNVFVFK